MDYNLHDFLPLYHPLQTREGEKDVNSLTEFVRYTLPREESFPGHPGDLMLHQKLISNFINPHTPYDGLLLVHEMECCVWRKKCCKILFLENFVDFLNYFILDLSIK